MQSFRQAAEATANAAAHEAKRELAKAVGAAARDVAEHVEARQKLQWLCSTIATCTLCLAGIAWLMHARGTEAGYGLGYTSGYEAAHDEKAAASWAASPDGKAAYRLAQAGSLRLMAPGWYVEGGYCFPAQAANGLYGWRIEPR